MNNAVDRFNRAARLALSSWNLEGATLDLIKHRENAVFSVSIGVKPAYVLRLHRPGYHSNAALESELEWMAMLSSSGVRTPRVVPAKSGDLIVVVSLQEPDEQIQCDLLTFVEGRPIGSVECGGSDEPDALHGVYLAAGRAAATIHQASAAWCRPSDFTRPLWDERGCIGPHALWGHFGDLEALSKQQLNELKKGVHVAGEMLQKFGKPKSRFGLIHCDLVPDNLILTPEGELVVIDFDDSGDGWYMWEIATAVFWLIGTQSYGPALLAMLKGYEEVLGRDEASRNMLVCMLFLRGLVYLGWMHTRRGTPTANELTAHTVSVTLALCSQILRGDMNFMNVSL